MRVSLGVDVRVPSSMSGWIHDQPALLADYLSLWESYQEGDTYLRMILDSYKTREKLAEDGPALAALLPAREVKASLPCVPVADVMARLAALGLAE